MIADPSALAIEYLLATRTAAPAGAAELERELAEVGLTGCGHELLTRGIACLHWGRVPERA